MLLIHCRMLLKAGLEYFFECVNTRSRTLFWRGLMYIVAIVHALTTFILTG